MSSEAITRNDLKAVLDEVLPIKPEINDCAVFHTAVVTWDRFSDDLFAGFIDASTIGVSDLTKYHWFIGEQPSWQQHNQIQSVSANEMLLRCWSMASPTDGKVVLLRNTKPSPFRLIGIKKYSD